MKYQRDLLKRIGYWFCSLCLGVIVLGAGVGKALDLSGFIGVIKTYELALPDWALLISGTTVTLFELGLGAWILSGWRLRFAALLSAVMNFGYLVLLTSALWRGLELQNCGCYGVFLARPLRWYTPLEDLSLIAVSVALFYLSAGPESESGTAPPHFIFFFFQRTSAKKRSKPSGTSWINTAT
jgi:uncharacterized membrane protein YphA (DoxX/SURF4 family)